MAADSCTNVYDRPIPDGARKILRLAAGRGQLLLGFAGAGGLPNVCAAQLEVPPPPDPGADLEVWAGAVAKAVTEIGVAAGLVEEGKLDANLLLGWRGRVWTLTHMQAIPHRDGVAAIGSGEGPAIGALDALLATDQGYLGDGEMVARACAIAVERDRFSAGPIVVELLDGATDASAVG